MSDFTKVAFNATKRTVTALEWSSDHLGLSNTDTANRALQVYAGLLRMTPGQSLTVENPDGTFRRIVLTDTGLSREEAQG